MKFERLLVGLSFAACTAMAVGCAGSPASGGVGVRGSGVVPDTGSRATAGFQTTFGGYFQIVGGQPPKNAKILGTAIGVDSSGDSHATFKQTVVFTKNPNVIKDGHFNFAYADGSTLIGRYAGTGTPPNAAGYSDGSGAFTVTKGTGRFANTAGDTGTWTVSVQIFAPGSSPAGVLNATFQGFGSH